MEIGCLVATDTATATTSPTQEPQLKRHVGVIGLLFASVGSIIGSGLAVRRVERLDAAGPAAIISWALGGVMILLIA